MFEIFSLFSDVPTYAGATLLAAIAARRSPAPQARRVWQLLTASLIVYNTGNVLNSIYWYFGHDPFPSVGDVFFLAFYPLLLAAVLAIVRTSAVRVPWGRLALDGMILALGFGAFFWFFVIRPSSLASSDADTVKHVLAQSYIILTCLMVLTFGVFLMNAGTGPLARRTLMLRKSPTEAMRARPSLVAAATAVAHNTGDKRHQAFVDLMIPVVKGWCTETGIEVASLGVQVHGGMGFVDETGAAQYLRDARITTIYEGTTGIQAMDLVGRKIAREGGATAKAWLAELKKLDAKLAAHPEIRKALVDGMKAVEECVDFIVAAKDPRVQFAGAVPFLKLMGIVAGGWQMARAALAADTMQGGDQEFLKAKKATARFYADHVLVQAPGLRNTVVNGAAGVLDLPEDQFLAA